MSQALITIFSRDDSERESWPILSVCNAWSWSKQQGQKYGTFMPSPTLDDNRKLRIYFSLKAYLEKSSPRTIHAVSFMSCNRASRATCNSLLAAWNAFSILLALANISLSIKDLFLNNSKSLSTRREWALDLKKPVLTSGSQLETYLPQGSKLRIGSND